jgi:hypothetical protein
MMAVLENPESDQEQETTGQRKAERSGVATFGYLLAGLGLIIVMGTIFRHAPWLQNWFPGWL